MKNRLWMERRKPKKLYHLDWAEKIRKKYSPRGEYGFAGATLTFLEGEKHSEPQNGGEERRLMLFFQNLIFYWENSIGVKLSIGNERVLEKSVRLALETAIQKLTSEEKTHFSREVKIARELLEGKEKTEIQMQKSLVFRRWQEGYSWEEISGRREIREYAERLEETRSRRQELARIRNREIASIRSGEYTRIQSKGMADVRSEENARISSWDVPDVPSGEKRRIRDMEIEKRLEGLEEQSQAGVENNLEDTEHPNGNREDLAFELEAFTGKLAAEPAGMEELEHPESSLVYLETKEALDGASVQQRAESRGENLSESAHERKIERGKESQREIERQLEKQMENLKESAHWSEKQQESQREFVHQEEQQRKEQSESLHIQTEQQKVQSELIRQQEQLIEMRTQLEKETQIQQIHEERAKETFEQEQETKLAAMAEAGQLEIEKERVRTERQNQPEERTAEPAGMEALDRPESSLVYLEAKETAHGTGIQPRAERQWENSSEKAYEREIESEKESQREIERRESRLEKQMEKLKESIHWSEKQQESQREFARQEKRQQKAQSELRNIQTEQQKMQSELIRQQEQLTETQTQLEKEIQIQQIHEERAKEVLEQEREKKQTVRAENGWLEIEKERVRTEHQNQPEEESRLESIPEWQNRGGEDASVESKVFREELTVKPAGMEALDRPESSLVYLEAKETAHGTGIQPRAERQWENSSEKAYEREIESGKESQREIERRESRLEKQMEKLKESIHWSEKQQESQREFARQEKRQQKAQSELRNIQTEQQKMQSELIWQQEQLTKTRTQLEKETQIQQIHEERVKEILEQEREKKQTVRAENGWLEIEKERVRIERQNQPEEFTAEPAGMQMPERPESSLVYREAKKAPDESRQDKAQILLKNLSESASQRKKHPENRLFPSAVKRWEKNVETMEKVLERFHVATETRKSGFSEPHIVETHTNVRLEKMVSETLQQKQEKIRSAALQQNHRVRTIKHIIPRLEVLSGNWEMRTEILEAVGKTSGYESGQELISLPELSTTAKIQYTVPESRKTDRTNVRSEVSAISATLTQTQEETRILRKNTGYTRTALIEQEKKIDGIRKELHTQMKQVNEEVRRLMDTQKRDMSVQNLAGQVMKELQRQFRTEKIRRGY